MTSEATPWRSRTRRPERLRLASSSSVVWPALRAGVDALNGWSRTVGHFPNLPRLRPFKTSSRALVALLASVALQAQDTHSRPLDGPEPWFGTFSIVAVDPVTKELGVGVQSRAFGAGAAVPYAKAGVGAVATQASANRQYGPKAIALLEQGLSPAEVVKRITDEDPGRDTRQVAVIDMQGRSAVYTGKRVIDRNSDPTDLVHLGGYAGHVTGVNFSTQGNTLASRAVVEAMAEAYQSGKGSMAERLMDALDAGQAKGGDTRGIQSAGLLVVRPIPPGSDSTVERVVDVRVDDHENPFVELRRLMRMTLGEPNALTERAAILSKSGQHAEAIRLQQQALAINPRSEALMYALAQRYAQAGDAAKALEQLGAAINRQPVQWKAQAAADPIFARLKDDVAFRRLVTP
jgi:uncharacterized Ntn-hydrolase superfamily protein